MDRLVASDRQVLVFGEYESKAQSKEPIPTYKDLHVLNLGPSYIYVGTLKAAYIAADAVATLSLGHVLAPGEAWKFFEFDTFARLTGEGLRQPTYGGPPREVYVYKAELSCVSPHGLHLVKLTLQRDQKTFQVLVGL